jgi:hypothetical protein
MVLYSERWFCTLTDTSLLRQMVLHLNGCFSLFRQMVLHPNRCLSTQTDGFEPKTDSSSPRTDDYAPQTKGSAPKQIIAFQTDGSVITKQMVLHLYRWFFVSNQWLFTQTDNFSAKDLALHGCTQTNNFPSTQLAL